MSDAPKPGGRTPSNPGIRAAPSIPRTPSNPGLPATTPTPKPATPRTVTNPGMKAVSAARAQPLAAPVGPAITKEKLKSEAANTALNLLAMARELWADFRASDRFFKYKAGIIAAWVVLSASGFFVACPSGGFSNDIGAKLVVAGEATAPIYMIKNSGTDPWKDVVVVVNGGYRAAYAEIAPNGSITLTPKLLTGPDTRPAPANLRITELEVHTHDGNTSLLRGGQPVQ